jgi:hypothetical protein
MIIHIEKETPEVGFVSWTGSTEDILRFFAECEPLFRNKTKSGGLGGSNSDFWLIENEYIPRGIAATIVATPFLARRLQDVKAEYLSQRLSLPLPLCVFFQELPVSEVLSISPNGLWKRLTKVERLIAFRMACLLRSKGDVIDQLARLLLAENKSV